MASSLHLLPLIHGFRPLAEDERTETGDALFIKVNSTWKYFGLAPSGHFPCAWISSYHPYRWADDLDGTIHNPDDKGEFNLLGYFNIKDRGDKIRSGDVLMSRIGVNGHRKYVFRSDYIGMNCFNWYQNLLYRRYGCPVEATIKKKINVRATAIPLP